MTDMQSSAKTAKTAKTALWLKLLFSRETKWLQSILNDPFVKWLKMHDIVCMYVWTAYWNYTDKLINIFLNLGNNEVS
jgi:predicted protein tyrosine phosphatase